MDGKLIFPKCDKKKNRNILLDYKRWKCVKNCIPLIIVLCIIPFITRLHLYTMDMNAYAWYGLTTEFTDFFSYGKAYVFVLLSTYMFVKLLWDVMQRKRKIVKSISFFLFCGTALFLGISTAGAKNKEIAIMGGYQRFEGLLVLLGYLIVCVYAYTYVVEHDELNYLFIGISVVAVLFCIIGFLQISGNDPLFSEAIKKIILPHELWDKDLQTRLEKDTVYLTLANSNYASMYLASLIPLLFSYAQTKVGIKKVTLYFVCILVFICMIFTYSRVGILMVCVEGIVGIWICRKKWMGYWKQSVLCLLGLIIIFVTMDGVMGFRFTERLKMTFESFSQTRKNCAIEDLKVEQDGIYFTLNGITIKVHAKYGYESKEGLTFYEIRSRKNSIEITDCYNADNGILEYEGMESLKIFIVKVDEEPMLILRVGDTVFRFAQDYIHGYMLYVGNGKYDLIQDVEYLDFHGLESLASGRGYLWSRTIPLLKEYAVIGCGADNFFLVFPQNDYWGKAQYCKTPLTIVEKPHNTYLLFTIQNGLIPLIMLLVVYFIYLKKAIRCYSGKENYTMDNWMGIGILVFSVAYVVGYVFNDSSINISPIFWVMLGVGNRMLGK